MAFKYSANIMLLSISRDNCLLSNVICLLIVANPRATVREMQRILIRISVMFDIILLFFFIYQIFYNNSLRYSAPFGLGSQPLFPLSAK